MDNQFENVHNIFNKKFTFPRNSDSNLPKEVSIFKTKSYKYGNLQQYKKNLNFVKSKLNDFSIEKWSAHTRKCNPAGEIQWRLKKNFNVEFMTQAWCKMFECLNSYDIIVFSEAEKFNSLHLCEAPGAFVVALNHYLKLNYRKTQWKWLASTLNPYYEGNELSDMVCDDRFLLHTLRNWYFGDDYTGNIVNKKNITSLKKRCSSMGPVTLITADGSVDCLASPEEQENKVAVLHLCETACALNILEDGGSFILKMFTFFESSSVNLLFFLNNCFEFVHVFKPATSKEGNSEVYVICLKYKRSKLVLEYVRQIIKHINKSNFQDKALFDQCLISNDFVIQIENCAKMFMSLQVGVIERNISNYNKKIDLSNLRYIKSLIADRFIDIYKMDTINECDTLLYGKNVCTTFNINVRMHSGSHSERIRSNHLSKEEEINSFKNKIKKFGNVWPNDSFINWVDFEEINGFKLIPIYGKPIINVKSSLFVITSILKLYNSITDKYKGPTNYCNTETVERLRSQYNLGKFICLTLQHQKNHSFHTYDYYEKNLFNKLSNLKVVKGQHLAIWNFPSLTQFSVGILYIYGKFCYEKVGFVKDGCILFYNYIGTSMDFLQKIKNFTQQYNKNGKLIKSQTLSLLSVINIELIRSGHFYESLVTYNNSLLLDECSAILERMTI